MTPKEKAEELVKIYTDFNSSTLKMMNGKYSTGIAKKCALKAVDEVLSIKKEIWDDFHSEYFKYWQEVQQEINKL